MGTKGQNRQVIPWVAVVMGRGQYGAQDIVDIWAPLGGGHQEKGQFGCVRF